MAEYIKGIIFFLVFASFVGIILPEGKYKKYINLVMGFVVMALIFKPVTNLGGIVGNISAQLSQPVSLGSEAFDDTHQQMIADAVKAQMYGQLSRAADALGYSLINLDTDIDLDTGEIKSITMTLTDQKDRSEIVIAPITLLPKADSPENDIKKIVSDFYQLQEEHIYVIIR